MRRRKRTQLLRYTLVPLRHMALEDKIKSKVYKSKCNRLKNMFQDRVHSFHSCETVETLSPVSSVGVLNREENDGATVRN